MEAVETLTEAIKLLNEGKALFFNDKATHYYKIEQGALCLYRDNKLEEYNSLLSVGLLPLYTIKPKDLIFEWGKFYKTETGKKVLLAFISDKVMGFTSTEGRIYRTDLSGKAEEKDKPYPDEDIVDYWEQ